jgi:prevent-host-death family protein
MEVPMKMFNIHAAKTQLSRLIEQAAAGEEIVIAKAGKPVARLVPFEPRREPRKPGLMKGQIWIAEDFDDPLPEEIMAAFRGERP